MNTTQFRSTAIWFVCGMITLPVLAVVLSYVFGVVFRPADITLSQAFVMISESVFTLSTDSDSFMTNLPIWLSAGGILGVVAYAVRSILRRRSIV
jgi:hypothetical protein